MNQQLQNFARNYLKTNVSTLPADNQRVFKLMYARNGGKRSVEEAIAMDVAGVVDEMSADSLDWAMQQVEATLKKLEVPA